MINNQFKLCCEVLGRLDNEGVLNHIVLIGSWCLLAYEDFFAGIDYRPGIRTRDIDLLVPIPPRFDHDVDLAAVLRDLDFVLSRKGRAGYMQNGDEKTLRMVFDGMPKTWQKTVRGLLSKLPLAENLTAILS